MDQKKKIRVCGGPNCSARGSERIMEMIEKEFGTTRGTNNGQVDLDFCGCTGYCELGPNVWLDEKVIHHSKTEDIVDRIKKGEGTDVSQPPKVDLKDDFLGDI